MTQTGKYDLFKKVPIDTIITTKLVIKIPVVTSMELDSKDELPQIDKII